MDSIEFDPDKDKINVKKHGHSLSLAIECDWLTAMVDEDDSERYGEQRFLAIGMIGSGIFTLTVTFRDNRTRIISLRQASRQEIKRWIEEQ
jgi:uncharacterized protein